MNTLKNVFLGHIEKVVYQAIPMNQLKANIYCGFMNFEETRTADELKSCIEAKTGEEYEMCEIILVGGEGVKIEFN